MSEVRPYGKGRPMERGPCGYEECGRIADIPTVGLCRGHYDQRWRGEELRPLRQDISLEDRLFAKREIDPETDCWNWTGATDGSGYGTFGFGGKTGLKAHRSACEIWIGPIDGDTVHHKCANRLCFNPDHLELATRRENGLEMHERRAFKQRITFLETRVAELETRLMEGVAG